MRTDVIMAGLGGQGLMTMGQVLAAAALREGRMTSYLPSYSPEVRGGWAYCTVVISDEGIGSPVVGEPSALIAVGRYALSMHAANVRSGGLILVNASLLSEPVERDDVRLINLPASEVAARLGDDRTANMVMLGAYVRACEAVALASVEEAIGAQLIKRPQLLEINLRALAEGAALVG